MSKYNRKQKTPKEDEFISFWHRAYNVLEPYFSKIGVTLLSALVVIFVVWGITSWLERRSQSAAEQFGRAIKVYDADLIGDTPPPATDEENPIPRFKTSKERADAALAELDKLDKSYGSSDVAREAVLVRAGILYDQQRWDDAAAAYDKYLKAGARDEATAAVAREGAGLAAEQRGKLDEALGLYQQMVPKNPKDEFYRDRALYNQARVFTKKGDKKKAAELYKEILAKVPNTSLKEEVQAQLAQVEGS